MKFQCGKCDKYFTINNTHTIDKDLEFRCDNCTNVFTIKRNLVFSSSSKNSKIICENCGKIISESHKSCNSCNLILNKAHEEWRIDNKHYESLEISENGSVCSSKYGKKLTKKNKLMPVTIAVVVTVITLAGYLLKTDKLPTLNISMAQKEARIETQVIIMKSGQTYYADKVEKDSVNLRITNKNGVISQIPISDVLQISTAVIDQ